MSFFNAFQRWEKKMKSYIGAEIVDSTKAETAGNYTNEFSV